VSKICQSRITWLWQDCSVRLLWQGCSDKVALIRLLWQDCSVRLHWQVALTRLLCQVALTGCTDKIALSGCTDRLHWQVALTGCTDRLHWQVALTGCSDKVALTSLLCQVALTGCSDRLFWQAHLTLLSKSANFVWSTLTTYSTFDPRTLVVTNPGGQTIHILSQCKSGDIVYTAISTIVLFKLWQNSHTTLSLKDSQSVTAILSISLSTVCL